MANATHTPGPWGIYQNSICTEDGKANEIAKVTRYGVWMDDGSPYGAHNPIGDANARLMAAAPDLLAALEAVVTPSGWDKLDTGGRGTHGAALAAIAKARGE